MKEKQTNGLPEARDGDTRRILRSAGRVGALTLLSRITGLIRVNTQAHFLGTGDAADAFRIALLIPSLLRKLVGEGAMPGAFVPVLVSYYRRGDRQALRILAEKVYTLWAVGLVVLTAVGIMLSGWLLALYGDLLDFSQPATEGWTREKLELTAQLTRWLFIYLTFIGLTAVGQGILNATGVFALPAASPLIYNLVFVAAGYLLANVFPGDDAAWSFVVGVLVGGVLQLVFLVPSLWKRGIRFRPRWPGDHPGVREILRLLVPVTFGAGVYQINVLVSSMVAMSIPVDGAVASLDYSSRLMEFVLGVFVFALSTVGLTTLSRQVATNDVDGLRSTASQLLRLSWFITVPSTVGLMILAEHVVVLLLESGEFTHDRSTPLTLQAFYCHLPGLLFVGVARVVTSVFYAFKEVSIPVKVGLVNLLVNVVLAIWLSATALQHGGVALASSLAAIVQAALLLILLQRRRRLFNLWRLVGSFLKSLLASGVMGVGCLIVVHALPTAESRWLLALQVSLEISLGVGIYLTVAWLLGASELRLVLGRWWRRQ